MFRVNPAGLLNDGVIVKFYGKSKFLDGGDMVLGWARG